MVAAGHWDPWTLVSEAPSILANGGGEGRAEGQQAGARTAPSAARG